MLHSLRRFSRNEVAQERYRILRFYDAFGEKATKEAMSKKIATRTLTGLN